MTNIKTFIIGALLGTLVGAFFLGAIAQFFIVGLAIVGAVTAALAIRRHRLPRAPGHRDLKRASAQGTDGGL
jgi:mannose/fructose/N-acetylgalactosamine-specific phosphotransferase system component IIC